jgi:CHRD domain-containing protein
MTRARIVCLLAGLLVVGMVVAPASADNEKDRTLTATLKGIEEPPSVSSTGRGTFRGLISEDGTSLSYTISYEDLEGDILQSHIHLGQRGVNGGIAVFLCSNLGNGPEGTPACPGPREGTVSRTVTGADIVGPSGQGLTTGEFAELLRAIDKNVTYANVHTVKHNSGEIRGQITRED